MHWHRSFLGDRYFPPNRVSFAVTGLYFHRGLSHRKTGRLLPTGLNLWGGAFCFLPQVQVYLVIVGHPVGRGGLHSPHSLRCLESLSLA